MQILSLLITSQASWGKFGTHEHLARHILSEGVLATHRGLLRLDGNRTKAWPKARVTLCGLLAFARFCPNITVLRVEFDAKLPAAYPDVRPRSTLCDEPQTSALTFLDVGLSPIDDPYAVAAFLSDTFPNSNEIQDVWGDFGIGGEDARWNAERWVIVSGLISRFVRVRVQERNWKKKSAPSKVADVDTDGIV